MNRRGYRLFQIMVLVLVIIVDQVVKWWWLHHKSAVLNPGIAFGFWGSNYWVILIVLALWIIWHQKQSHWGWWLIFGGGVSNLIDRLTLGAVVDMIKLPFWPTTFNLADAAIVAGSVWLVVSSLAQRRYNNGDDV